MGENFFGDQLDAPIVHIDDYPAVAAATAVGHEAEAVAPARAAAAAPTGLMTPPLRPGVGVGAWASGVGKGSEVQPELWPGSVAAGP